MAPERAKKVYKHLSFFCDKTFTIVGEVSNKFHLLVC